LQAFDVLFPGLSVQRASVGNKKGTVEIDDA